MDTPGLNDDNPTSDNQTGTGLYTDFMQRCITEFNRLPGDDEIDVYGTMKFRFELLVDDGAEMDQILTKKGAGTGTQDSE